MSSGVCCGRRPRQAMVLWATVHHMTRRLTRDLAGPPAHGHWSDHRRCRR
ncbi:hypothetical protein ABT299_40340 [Spirillospora sp. NPDC000708]